MCVVRDRSLEWLSRVLGVARILGGAWQLLVSISKEAQRPAFAVVPGLDVRIIVGTVKRANCLGDVVAGVRYRKRIGMATSLCKAGANFAGPRRGLWRSITCQSAGPM